MTPEPEKFRHFLIAQNVEGQSIHMSRSPGEAVFLAFDLKARRLSELHLLRAVSQLDAAGKRSVRERLAQASDLRGGSFAQILAVGEDDGLIYYSSALNDGEFVGDYIARRGALPPATALCLLRNLLDDLVQLQGYKRLISRLRLSRVLVTLLEDTFLNLRIFDLGLSQKEEPADGVLERLSTEACELIFLLLAGHPFAGENPDIDPSLNCLPASFRSVLKTVLSDSTKAHQVTLGKLLDEVKEALASNLQSLTARKHLIVTHENLLPKSQLQDLLLENIAVETLLQGRYTVESAGNGQSFPFAIPARDVEKNVPVTVHLLPPSRIVPKNQSGAVPVQMRRFDPRRHPNILRSLSLWENPDWIFFTEERAGGFVLSRLMAERMALDSKEVLALLKQVRDGINQALECGVSRVDLHPSNLVLQFADESALSAEGFENLMKKRVNAWPPFRLKLRLHMTMRSLYEPLLSNRPAGESEAEEQFHDQDFCNRSFVALAAYMLTGERLIERGLEFPKTVPQHLAEYMSESMEKGRVFGKTPTPNDFLSGFSKRTRIWSGKRRLLTAAVRETTGGPDRALGEIFGRVVWGAVAIGILSMLLWLIMGDSQTPPASDQAARVAATTEKSSPVISETPKPTVAPPATERTPVIAKQEPVAPPKPVEQIPMAPKQALASNDAKPKAIDRDPIIAKQEPAASAAKTNAPAKAVEPAPMVPKQELASNDANPKNTPQASNRDPVIAMTKPVADTETAKSPTTTAIREPVVARQEPVSKEAKSNPASKTSTPDPKIAKQEPASQATTAKSPTKTASVEPMVAKQEPVASDTKSKAGSKTSTPDPKIAKQEPASQATTAKSPTKTASVEPMVAKKTEPVASDTKSKAGSKTSTPDPKIAKQEPVSKAATAKSPSKPATREPMVAKQEPASKESAKPKSPPDEPELVVRKAMIPTAAEIEEFRRKQAAAAKEKAEPAATSSGVVPDSTASGQKPQAAKK